MSRATYKVDEGGGQDQSTDKIDHDEEAHRKAAEATHVGEEHELGEVVHGRVDPATTLRQENAPRVGSYRHSLSFGEELGLKVGEVLEDEGREVTILSEGEQVLLVQGIEDSLRLMVDEMDSKLLSSRREGEKSNAHLSTHRRRGS